MDSNLSPPVVLNLQSRWRKVNAGGSERGSDSNRSAHPGTVHPGRPGARASLPDPHSVPGSWAQQVQLLSGAPDFTRSVLQGCFWVRDCARRRVAAQSAFRRQASAASDWEAEVWGQHGRRRHRTRRSDSGQWRAERRVVSKWRSKDEIRVPSSTSWTHLPERRPSTPRSHHLGVGAFLQEGEEDGEGLVPQSPWSQLHREDLWTEPQVIQAGVNASRSFAFRQHFL